MAVGGRLMLGKRTHRADGIGILEVRDGKIAKIPKELNKIGL